MAFIKVDGQGRILVFSTLLIMALNFYKFSRFREIAFSAPSFILLMLVIFSAVNLKVKGYHESYPFIYFFLLSLFKQYAVMLVAMFEAQKDPIKLCKFLLGIFLTYGLLAVTVLGGGGSVGREIGALGNAAPLTVMYIVFFVSILHLGKAVKPKTVLVAISFVLIIIIAAATRKALGSVGIMLAFLLLSQIDLKLKNILLVTIATIILFFGASAIIENSMIGERFEKGVAEGEILNTSDIELLSLLGDRAVFYIGGWDVFVKHPLTGIGLRNYFHTTSRNYVLHTEYMVQLAENGLIGFILFMSFNYWYLSNLLAMWLKSQTNRKVMIVLTGGILSILFISLTAWIYSFPQYFIVYGVVAGILFNLKLSRNEKIRISKEYRMKVNSEK